MTNPTQRFVMVKVTGCKDCCFNRQDLCCQRLMLDKKTLLRKVKFLENKDAITSSCPMYPQSQEEEK